MLIYKTLLKIIVPFIFLCSAAYAQIPMPKDIDGLNDLTRPIAISSQTVFTNIPGGIGNATQHSYHRVTNILQTNFVPLYFDVENGKVGNSEYFKETYRVMYVTMPDQVIKDGSGTMPIPIPPFFGNFNGSVYMVGICLNKNRSPKAPALTPWVVMQDYKIYTQ